MRVVIWIALARLDGSTIMYMPVHGASESGVRVDVLPVR